MKVNAKGPMFDNTRKKIKKYIFNYLFNTNQIDLIYIISIYNITLVLYLSIIYKWNAKRFSMIFNLILSLFK